MASLQPSPSPHLSQPQPNILQHQQQQSTTNLHSPNQQQHQQQGSTTTNNPQSQRIYQYVLDLTRPDKRESALLELSKRREEVCLIYHLISIYIHIYCICYSYSIYIYICIIIIISYTI